jgi:hypothetical protein
MSGITGAFHENVSTFMTVSAWIILRMRNVQKKTVVEKIETYILCNYCFSTATVVTWTKLSVTLCVLVITWPLPNGLNLLNDEVNTQNTTQDFKFQMAFFWHVTLCRRAKHSRSWIIIKLYPENEGIPIFRNVRNYSPNNNSCTFQNTVTLCNAAMTTLNMAQIKLGPFF